MTEVDGSGADGGRRTLPWWGVTILIVAVVGSTIGWFIDRAADHPPPTAGPRGIIVVMTMPPWFGSSLATVVAVTSARDLVLDIGPRDTQGLSSPEVGLARTPALPVGRFSVTLSRIGTPAPTNCHAGEAPQLAARIITPGTQVRVGAVQVAGSDITVNIWRMDGTDVSTELIAAGVAPAWTSPGGAVSGNQSVAMSTAVDRHLGIWAPCPASG